MSKGSFESLGKASLVNRNMVIYSFLIITHSIPTCLLECYQVCLF